MRLSEALALAHSDAARDILRRASRLAIRRDGESEASIGLMLILQGTLALGLEMPAKTLSMPRWLVDFAASQGVSAADILKMGVPARPAPFDPGMKLRPAAVTAIQMACALAAATVGRSVFDARHLVVAALDCPDVSAAHQMRLDFAALGLDLAELRDALIARIIRTPEKGEDIALWEQLRSAAPAAWSRIMPSLGSSIDAATAAGPAAATMVSGFHADRTTIGPTDPLDIGTDVSAFARLICLEEARPPLSIGLFGEWGSGKSSFMEGLQGEITALTRKERTSRRAEAQASPNSPSDRKPHPRFVQNVVQIRFNAWHYADANLWASLTAEFFDQLRRGGYDGQRDSNYLALIEKVAERVRSLEALAQKAQDKLSDAERAAKRAEEALAAARKKLATSDLALASEQLSGQFEAIQSNQDDRAKLQEVGRRLYRDDLAADLDGFTATVSEATHWPGKIALVARIIAGGGSERRLAVLAIVLVAFAGIGWHIVDQASAAVAVGRLLAWAGASLAAFRAVAGALKLAKPVLDGAWTYAKAVEKARKELAREVEDKEVEARKAASVLDDARQQAQAAKTPLVKYGDAASAGAPGTILRYFLFEDSDVREYDKHVGLVSRARRSFEQLDSIFSAARDGREARDRRAAGLPLTKAQARSLERFQKLDLDQHFLHIPDRIVLYIDDLDRCTHAQVYDVLQAIHLLLAFELFVVVVGVDVRWVEEAVARQFPQAPTELSTAATQGERETAQRKAEMDRRKRAIEYLEKIFQLPFWLRPLSTAGEAGGSYGAYVKDLLQANLDVPEGTQSPFAARPDVSIFRTFTGPEDDGAVEPSAGDAVNPDAAAMEELASIDQALATVRLTQPEVDFLASPEIGALAAKSPRAVKRMINVYRIVRARLSEPELAAFLGRNGKMATWPLAVFFAAVECGQPVEIADALYRAVRTIPPHERFNTMEAGAILSSNEKALDAADGYEAIMLADEATDHAISLAAKAIERLMATEDRTDRRPAISDMLAMARIVRRYSFNRYH